MITAEQLPSIEKEPAEIAEPLADNTITVVIYLDKYQVEIEIYDPLEG